MDDRSPTGYAQVVKELVSGTVQRTYTYGLSGISENQSSSVSFYGYDGHGNVRLLTNASAAVTDRYDYDAFGLPCGQFGATPNVYRHSGERCDANLGLYNLRARYYSAAVGRFLTSDSTEGSSHDPSSLHKYLYTADNTVTALS